MNKQHQFIDWLCGKDVPFPFFQDMQDVQLPDMGDHDHKDTCTDCEEVMEEEI